MLDDGTYNVLFGIQSALDRIADALERIAEQTDSVQVDGNVM